MFMDCKWTLHVENFAKIKEADIEMAPLLCFVGDNNSGKSYLMSLIWGILSLGKDIFPKTPSDTKKYRACENWLAENQNNDVKLDREAQEMYLSWFNELLAFNKKTLLRRIFNYEVEIEKIEITNLYLSKALSIKWVEGGSRYSTTTTQIKFPLNEGYTRDDLLRMNAYICWNMLMSDVAAPLFTPIIKERRMGEPVYLPASRTGIMLTYPQLLNKSIYKSYSQFFSGTDETSTVLTLPYVNFLQLIVEFETSRKPNKKFQDLIDFMESEMTQGKLQVRKEFVPVIKYQPNGVNKELPLYVSSSIVSELSPLLLLLKSNINFKAIIIEEPEAHLHPELQKKMAQLIIRMMNFGIPVWITTHSDTILQHLNNMIKLEKNKKRKLLMERFNYSENDLLAINNIKMYQFEQIEKHRTCLTKLEQTDYGFVVPTFNDAIESIVEEVYAFQEEQ